MFNRLWFLGSVRFIEWLFLHEYVWRHPTWRTDKCRSFNCADPWRKFPVRQQTTTIYNKNLFLLNQRLRWRNEIHLTRPNFKWKTRRNWPFTQADKSPNAKESPSCVILAEKLEIWYHNCQYVSPLSQLNLTKMLNEYMNDLDRYRWQLAISTQSHKYMLSL